jgi:flavin-dependent dehydrogenase
MKSQQISQLSAAQADARKPNHRYDVVVVGARAAGASTAMLLAERGLDVLMVDRQGYASDTLSSHALMRGAVTRLAAWGLLETVWQADTPVISKTVFSYGDDNLPLDVKPEPGVLGLAAPRRTVLDRILVDAAGAAGTHVLHNTSLVSLIEDTDGRVGGVCLALADGSRAEVRSDLVIGADGLRSSVARMVNAPVTRRGTHASAYTLRYYENFDTDRGAFHWMYRPGAGGGVIPTSHGAVCVFTAMEPHVFKTTGRADVTGTHRANAARLNPALAEVIDRATPIGPIRSFPGVPGQFRRAQGPGWALVGDAGYFKDPFAAHGITDAFRDAELLTQAVLTGDYVGYETLRDELSAPLFEILDRVASYEWDLDQLMGLHLGMSRAMKAEDTATLAQPPIAA